MRTNDAWEGTVVKKSRGLLDGSNLYRRATVQLDDGTTKKVRLDRTLWKQVHVGDRVAKDAGGRTRKA